MSSRQEEKEQRRLERLEREQAEQSAAKRKRLVQIIGGVVVGAAIVVGVVLALAGGKEEPADTTGLASAARTAGCVVRSFPNEGQAHVEKKLTVKDFKTNPPTSGDHNVTPAPDGVYAPGNEPEIQNWVHTLEHGRILFMYKKGTPPARVAQLQKLFDETSLGKPAYHSVLMRNNTDMPFGVAAVAWRHYVGCSEFNDETVAALRAFRELYVDKAPEQIP
ncbi:MAG TPA: DUF3105 domain-containing protein [Solirubrobacteraceae bacterium]|nr:DUF3105 domain-containing protein [Solirubrobacteraceae bacterium]